MKTLVTLLCLMAGLQQSAAPAEIQPQQLIALVRDSQGGLVRHLRANDFVVEEDGVPQTITSFEEDSDIPVSLGILIDTSLSMNERSGGMSRLSAAQGTVRMLLRMMHPGDQFILMSFDANLSVKQDFTDDPRAIEAPLNKLTTNLSTNLFAAVDGALQKMKKAKYRTRALVLISDGIATDMKSLSSRIRESEILIYTFGLGDKRTANMPQPVFPTGGFGRGGFGGGGAQATVRPQEILDTLANDSGGSSEIFDVADLDKAIQEMAKFNQSIVADMRGQYTIGYDSKIPGGPSGHSIRLKAVAADYRVRMRRNTASLFKAQGER